MSENGGAVREVVEHAAEVLFTQQSPTGQESLVVKEQKGKWFLFLKTAIGAPERKLTEIMIGSMPVFSPDGTKIMAVMEDGTLAKYTIGGYKLRVVRVTGGRINSIAWSWYGQLARSPLDYRKLGLADNLLQVEETERRKSDFLAKKQLEEKAAQESLARNAWYGQLESLASKAPKRRQREEVDAKYVGAINSAASRKTELVDNILRDLSTDYPDNMNNGNCTSYRSHFDVLEGKGEILRSVKESHSGSGQFVEAKVESGSKPRMIISNSGWAQTNIGREVDAYRYVGGNRFERLDDRGSAVVQGSLVTVTRKDFEGDRIYDVSIEWEKGEPKDKPYEAMDRLELLAAKASLESQRDFVQEELGQKLGGAKNRALRYGSDMSTTNAIYRSMTINDTVNAHNRLSKIACELGYVEKYLEEH